MTTPSQSNATLLWAKLIRDKQWDQHRVRQIEGELWWVSAEMDLNKAMGQAHAINRCAKKMKGQGISDNNLAASAWTDPSSGKSHIVVRPRRTRQRSSYDGLKALGLDDQEITRMLGSVPSVPHSIPAGQVTSASRGVSPLPFNPYPTEKPALPLGRCHRDADNLPLFRDRPILLATEYNEIFGLESSANIWDDEELRAHFHEGCFTRIPFQGHLPYEILPFEHRISAEEGVELFLPNGLLPDGTPFIRPLTEAQILDAAGIIHPSKDEDGKKCLSRLPISYFDPSSWLKTGKAIGRFHYSGEHDIYSFSQRFKSDTGSWLELPRSPTLDDTFFGTLRPVEPIPAHWQPFVERLQKARETIRQKEEEWKKKEEERAANAHLAPKRQELPSEEIFQLIARKDWPTLFPGASPSAEGFASLNENLLRSLWLSLFHRVPDSQCESLPVWEDFLSSIRGAPDSAEGAAQHGEELGLKERREAERREEERRKSAEGGLAVAHQSSGAQS